MGKLPKGKIPRRMAAVPVQPPQVPSGAKEEEADTGEGVVAVTPEKGSKWNGQVLDAILLRRVVVWVLVWGCEESPHANS